MEQGAARMMDTAFVAKTCVKIQQRSPCGKMVINPVDLEVESLLLKFKKISSARSRIKQNPYLHRHEVRCMRGSIGGKILPRPKQNAAVAFDATILESICNLRCILLGIRCRYSMRGCQL